MQDTLFAPAFLGGRHTNAKSGRGKGGGQQHKTANNAYFIQPARKLQRRSQHRPPRLEAQRGQLQPDAAKSYGIWAGDLGGANGDAL